MPTAPFSQDADVADVTGIGWMDRAAIARAHAPRPLCASTCRTPGRVRVRDPGDVAAIHARMALTVQVAPDGTPTGARAAILTIVLARTPDGWQAVGARSAVVEPGTETWPAPAGDREAHVRSPPAILRA